ncbi:substrate-binding domain-containing protein [Methylocapsa sp. S129]|uniref:substrate-binding domain-containing protein n=1 Tax=Methylocapsa sp. S129 TaxID=1641869 RepID=UPI001AEDD2B6|nr:substrate-binding domain-containing protein [Methylocapsa sp. S129]
MKAMNRLGIISSAVVAAALLFANGASATDKTIHITLITKDPDNHFWTAMVEGAKEAAKGQNVEITVAAGRDQSDADGQIQAIEYAVSRGDDAILIANNGPAVNEAVKKAQAAGLYVLALDTPFSPTKLVAATLASDNYEAGQLIGKWTAATLGGKKATIAMLDLFADKVVSIDWQRDHGFLNGMGVKTKDPQVNGREDKTGKYSGGDYEIICNGATNGAEDGGRTVMENCLSINPKINVVFSANETSGVGAVQALKAAGIKDALVVSIDGSCRGVKAVASGDFGALSQQYPSAMGRFGVKAVIDHIRNHAEPVNSKGVDFVNTGITLVTDKPVAEMKSIDSKKGAELCW